MENKEDIEISRTNEGYLIRFQIPAYEEDFKSIDSVVRDAVQNNFKLAIDFTQTGYVHTDFIAYLFVDYMRNKAREERLEAIRKMQDNLTLIINKSSGVYEKMCAGFPGLFTFEFKDTKRKIIGKTEVVTLTDLVNILINRLATDAELSELNNRHLEYVLIDASTYIEDSKRLDPIDIMIRYAIKAKNKKKVIIFNIEEVGDTNLRLSRGYEALSILGASCTNKGLKETLDEYCRRCVSKP